MNQLECLKKFTTIVADSSDINSIRLYTPQDATTNPSIILKSVDMVEYQPFIEDALEYARKQGGSRKTKIINASDKLSVNIGINILKEIPGSISTEIDARLSFDRGMCIAKARKLIGLYQDQGIEKVRILIKLASTWEGIKAAEELEKENIKCNLTLLFSFAQARACADAGVYIISPFVGRIYDWYNKNNPSLNKYKIEEDHGIQSVKNIYNFYKKHRYKTIIMGASFRKIEQILALSGCDSLTISPNFLKQLYISNKSVKRILFPSTEKFHPLIPISESEFRWKHNQNAMAVEKLSEGIRQFSLDQTILENILSKKL